ncbi:MAG TPA: chromosome segregation protein SMC, partial [Chromatiaceae bacterium]|nr:chromosome segregation protein SMC [Chromatiaceae bacterium]
TGWEVALEGVLGILLEAVCVDDFALSARHLGSLKSGSVALIDIHQSASASTSSRSNRTLLSKINTPWSVDGLLAGIFVADSLDEALAQRSDLAAHESIVTRNGEWIGSNWARVNREEDARSGVLAREQELRDLNITVEQSEGLVRDAEQTHNALQARLQELEASREQQQATIDRMHRELSEARAEYAGKCARRDQMVARRQELTQEVEELRAALDKDQTELTSARSQLEQSLGEMEVLSQERSQRQDGKEALRQTLEQSREQARSLGARVHELALRVEAARSSRLSTQRALERMQEQQARLETRRADMEQGIEQGEAPLQALEAERAGFLEQRLLVEKELAGVRDRVEDLAQQLRSGEAKRHQSEEAVNTTRTVLEQGRLSRQETQVRLSTIEEQIGEIGFEPQALLEAIDDEVTEASCASELEAYGRRIQRLGAINLAAIDEFKEESERLEYLQLQHADLQKSLETLEDAIGKIDRETRSRFKDTFDKVNEGIKEKFPRLFGGGHAYLELTGEDMLDSGVTVMARPPGKKNSSIHLLSGGEKALTAVSLIFSIFDLNPAPFCMLDEVDAPLDDANVGRFCALVKEMSDRVQFIVITHNKVTMEMANHLSGVTMHEPGVSRLVSVDVEQATQMVAS